MDLKNEYYSKYFRPDLWKYPQKSDLPYSFNAFSDIYKLYKRVFNHLYNPMLGAEIEFFVNYPGEDLFWSTIEDVPIQFETKDHKICVFPASKHILLSNKEYNLYKYLMYEMTLYDSIYNVKAEGYSDKQSRASVWKHSCCYYQDGYSLEINTYPLKIRKGVVEQYLEVVKEAINEAYYFGKKYVGKDAVIRGWSMHHNFSTPFFMIKKIDESGIGLRSFYNNFIAYTFIVPYVSLFMLYPISSSRLPLLPERLMGDGKHRLNRVEMRGDYVNDFESLAVGYSLMLSFFYPRSRKNRALYKVVYGSDLAYEFYNDAVSTSVGAATEIMLLRMKKQVKRVVMFGRSAMFNRNFYDLYEELRDDAIYYGGKMVEKVIDDYIDGKRKTIIDKYLDGELSYADIYKRYYVKEPYEIDLSTYPKEFLKLKEQLERNEIEWISWKGIKYKNGKLKSFRSL